MALFCILTIVFLLSPEPVSSAHQLFETCLPLRCGSFSKITYPFWIQGKHPPHCGYPGFMLTCEEDEPILRMSDSDLIIREIIYQNQSFSVANKEWISNRNCTHPIHSLSFNSPSIVTAASNLELLFFFNCSAQVPQLHQYDPIPCFSNRTHRSFAVLNSSGSISMNTYSVLSKLCTSLSVPVMMDSKRQDSYATLLERGFLLHWTAPSCVKCLHSGGQCGYDQNEFKCFCADRPHLVRCDGIKNKGKKIIKGIIPGGILFILACSIILIGCVKRKFEKRNSFMFWKKKTYDRYNIKEFFANHSSFNPERFKYSQLRKITNSFQDKLGQGGYGSVFKGRLKDNRLVAVKILNTTKGSNDKEFINEVASISRTRHVNVVALLGFCFEGSKRALVYELMSNGSLEKFIFGNDLQKRHSLGCQKLFEISLGIAQGLEYLHRGCSTRIVHFDIKPHNILLDEDLCPKISDFGLAKLYPRRDVTISMTDARGTIGYIAPEVVCRNIGEVSHKSDVYSYGMMVLEMVGGRKNVDAQVEHTSEIYFPHWAYKHIGLEDGLSPLGYDTDLDKEVTKKMLLVGLWCIQTDPKSRPSMNEVVEMLEGSLDSLQMPPKPYLSSP